MNVFAAVALTAVGALTASLCLAAEFKPSRPDVEDYCNHSGRIFIKASVMAKSSSAETVKKYIKDEVNRTSFINKTFNTQQMKDFTAEKLYEDVPGAKDDIYGFMSQKSSKNKQQKEAHLVKSFSDGCVKGFFMESSKGR